MRVIRCIAAAAFLFASSAQAALISVTADTGWYAVAFEGVVIPEYGTMNLVYDTSVPDSDPSPTVGLYQGAIISFVMTVEQQNRPDLFFTLAPGSNSMRISFPVGDKAFQIFLTALDQSGAYGLVPVYLQGYRSGGPQDDLIPDAGYWGSRTFAQPSSVGPAQETDWGWNFRAVTLVPTAGTLALLLGGAAPLIAGGLVRRRVARSCGRPC